MASRRDFLRLSAIGAGGLIVAGGGLKLQASVRDLVERSKSLEMNLTRVPTYCEICFWKCAGWVYRTKDGDIWKIVGNPEDQHCNGRFCPRGTGGVGMYYDDERLKKPLIRTGERGEQLFREAEWDEALNMVAENLKKVADQYGPESIALFHHGSGGKYFTTLLQAMGSDSNAQPSFAQCKGPREVAFEVTFGEEVYSPERTDIRDTRCLVLIGAHIGENMHNGQIQEMSDAIDKGASIITVDPRFSIAASKSKYWLPIKPATDIALLLSWIHVIINEGWYDRDYVSRYTYGFEYLRDHVRNFTPEWAYGITTIKPDVIRSTAKEMANASPAVIVHPGRHVTWYGDDTQRLRAVAILNALLGSWGRRGGFYVPETASVPSAPHPPYPQPKKSWRDSHTGLYNLTSSQLSSEFVEASLPGNDRDLKYKAWVINGTNLIFTLPDQAKTIAALRNMDFVVAIDTMPMEITAWADVVLPECTYLERYDSIRTSMHRRPSIAVRVPAAQPKYDTRSAYWMAREIALRLGLGDYFPFEKQEDEIDWQLKQLGTSLEEMTRIGVKNFDRPYDDLYFSPGQEVEFFTGTGKIELYSTALAAEGFDPMPVYTPHEQPPAGFYRLNYGRAPMHTFSRTSNNPNLTALMPENALWVNPKVATIEGLENGQYVWLENQDGAISQFPIKVRVTERIRWDSVYMVHGFGHANKMLKRCFGKGASDTAMMTRVHKDPVMGGTGMRGNFVKILTEKPEEALS
ncbi:MAG: molybdopterin-containing oxidoreductase family protein [Bacteroidota bacterium]